MESQSDGSGTAFEIFPIGHVRRDDDGIRLEVLEPYRPALKELDEFSHVIALWWADQVADDECRQVLQCNPPYAEDHLTGVFATRSPLRPNPVAATTCKILSSDEEAGVVRIAEIDALDGTPVLDLKAYFPVCDRVREAHIPAWLSDWPEWMPDEGLGLEM